MTNSIAPNSFKTTLFKKEILLIFLAGFCFMLNLYTMLNLLPLYVITTGGTEFSAGLQNSIFNISAVVLRFLLGPIADTKGRKILLLTGSFVFATAPIAIWLAPSYPLQALARIYQAAGLATFMASASSLLADHTPYEYRGRMIGLYRGLMSFALMVGPIVGLKLINAKGYSFIFIFTSIISSISFISVLNLPKENIKKTVNLKVVEIADNMNKLLKHPILIKAYFGIGVVSLSYGGLLAYLTMYTLKSDIIKNPGIFFTIFAGVGIFATSFSGILADKLGREKIIWPSIICLGLGLCGLSQLNNFGSSIFYISAFLSGLGYSSAQSTLITWIIDNVDEKTRATALVLQENSIDLAMALGPFLLGIGTIVFELSSLFLVLGMFTIISALSLYKIKCRANSVD